MVPGLALGDGLSDPPIGAMVRPTTRGRTMARHLAGWIAGLLMMLAAQSVSAQQAAGDWLGGLAVSPTVTLHVAVHIHKDATGANAGTFDSLDQAVYGLPLGDISMVGGSLAFAIPTLHAAYAATWDAAAHGWTGQWTQGGGSLALTLTPGKAPDAPVITGLDGDWDGALTVTAGMKLRLALHVETGAHGTVARLRSIDQQTTVAVSSLSRDGDKVRLGLTVIGAVFEAGLDPKSQTLTGTWKQDAMPAPVPLVLTRRTAGQVEAAQKRPQTPVKPYPYREETVVFDDGPVKLAATLTLPQGAGPFPAVVLVSGSGPNTRNEPILGHQIFLVLADHFTRRGIAVLRYDKRGTGLSTGAYAKATTQDFADDADAAAAYLRGRKDINPAKVGMIGHSEGGLIVPMVAVADPKIDFIVMMAGPGVDGAKVLSEQGRLIGKAMGLSDEKVAESAAVRDRMIAIVRAEKDPEVAAAKMRAIIAAVPKAKDVPPAVIEAQIAAINTDWFRYFFNYDPAPTLRKVRCPVLAMIGSKDLQAPPDQNLPALRAALAQNPHAEVDELPGLNHLFQTAKTGAVGEYGDIEETIAPVALDKMTGWIVKQVGAPAR